MGDCSTSLHVLCGLGYPAGDACGGIGYQDCFYLVQLPGPCKTIVRA